MARPRRWLLGIATACFACGGVRGQESALPHVDKVAAQPLLAQVGRVAEAMDYLGSPLPEKARAALDAARKADGDAAVARAVQDALDPLCLFAVNVNPESRVKVAAGPAKPELVEGGWRLFLVKVHNEAGVT